MKVPTSAFLERVRGAPAAINFAWLTFDRCARAGVGLGLGVWMARVLGPGDYGRLNYALALAAMAGVLPTLGMDAILRRELARAPEASGQLLGTAFCLRLATGLLCYLVLAAAVLGGAVENAPTAVMLILGLSLVQPALQTVDVWFHGRLEARAVVLAQNTAFLGASVARAAALIYQADLGWIALTLVLDLPFAALLVFAAYRRRGQRLTTWRYDLTVARWLLRDAVPLTLSGVAIMIYHRIDQVMLPSLATPEAAGQYAAAVRIVEAWNFVPMALAASLGPALVRAHDAGDVQFAAETKRQFRRQAAVAWALALITAATAPWLLPRLFGPAYVSAGTIAALLSLSFPFVALGVARAEAWTAAGQARLSLPAALIGAVVNVGLNTWWIPIWGASGAAAATIVSYGLAAVGVTFCWAEARPLARRQIAALALRGTLWDRRSP